MHWFNSRIGSKLNSINQFQRWLLSLWRELFTVRMPLHFTSKYSHPFSRLLGFLSNFHSFANHRRERNAATVWVWACIEWSTGWTLRRNLNVNCRLCTCFSRQRPSLSLLESGYHVSSTSTYSSRLKIQYCLVYCSKLNLVSIHKAGHCIWLFFHCILDHERCEMTQHNALVVLLAISITASIWQTRQNILRRTSVFYNNS